MITFEVVYLHYGFCILSWCSRARRWEKYQSEEEAALGRGKRQRKAISYREAYASHPNETLSEVLPYCNVHFCSSSLFFFSFGIFFNAPPEKIWDQCFKSLKF